MATQCNIQIQYFNGSDYDVLYPQVQPSNITSGELTNNTISPSNILQGTLANQLLASANSVSNLTSTMIRNIYAGTTDMTVGSSVLPAGDIYLCYE